MCTVSWLRPDPSGRAAYSLFFNRDERRTRGPETPPAPGELAGVRFVAPRDTDFGGTWIAANERGVTVCILNGYSPTDTDPEVSVARTSRGLLVASLADVASAGEAAARLRDIDPADYRSFVLAAVDTRTSVVVEWDGAALREQRDADGRVPLISSAFRQPEVRERRQASYRALGTPTADVLEAFHRGHAGGRGPYSPCMHRDDAATRSLTRVDVGPDEVRVTHTPGPPCTTSAAPSLRLARRASHSAPR